MQAMGGQRRERKARGGVHTHGMSGAEQGLMRKSAFARFCLQQPARKAAAIRAVESSHTSHFVPSLWTFLFRMMKKNFQRGPRT